MANSVIVSSINRSTYLNAEAGTEIDMDDIFTMQVWIPRYKYKVWNYNADGNSASEEQEIEITFEEGAVTTGEIECQDAISGTDGSASETCKLKSTNITCTEGTCRDVYISNSSSFYTGRSGGNVAGSTPINGTYTETTSTTNYNKYGFYTYDGYLLSYGTNKKSTTKDLKKIASTTGNIYGVYDMSGGTLEYTMANIVSSDGSTIMSGYSSPNNSGYTGTVYDSGAYTSYTVTYIFIE